MITMEAVAQAARSLRRTPGHVAAFVVTLGLGVGVNASVFSAVSAVLLKDPPYREAERIVYLRHTAERAGVENALFSVPEIDDIRQRSSQLEGVAEFSSLTFTVRGWDDARRLRAGIVTGNFFEVMGLEAARGRVIGPSDDGEEAAPVAVLTHDFWRDAFGGDPGVVGRTLEMNGRAVTIVGIAQDAPPYPEETALYVNMVASPHHLGATMNHDRAHRMTEVFGRLAPGATLASLDAELAALQASIHAEHPEAYDASQGYAFEAHGLKAQLARGARTTLLILVATAGLVLLLACANVANLTLTRAMRRSREFAVRASLGAGRGAIRRLLLAENLLLSLGGAGLGLGLAAVSRDLLVRYVGRFTIRAEEIGLDPATVLGAGAVAVGVAVLLALLPSAARGEPMAGLGRVASRSAGTTGHRRLQRGLVVTQMAVSAILLAGGGLLTRTLLELQRADSGFVEEGVLAMRLPTIRTGRTEEEVRAFYHGLVREVRSLPGVVDAAMGKAVPLAGSASVFTSALELRAEGQDLPPGAPPNRADYRPVTPGYFSTLGISLVSGRLFRETDHEDAPLVVVLNQSLASRLFPDRDPVGQRVAWTGDVLRFIGLSGDWRTVVGVVGDTHDYGVDDPPLDAVYMPFAQEPAAGALMLRTSGDPTVLTSPVRQLIRAMDPGQPVEEIAPLEVVRDRSHSPQRLNATLIGSFSLLALVIAAVGIFAVLAFSVADRRREFGVRAALGADRPRLVRSVLAEGLLLGGGGLVLGFGIALAGSELVRGILYGVAPFDGMTFAAVGAGLLAVATAAAAVPAVRAASVDPVRVLKEE